MITNKSIYKPIPFVVITFCITWILAIFSAYQTWFSYENVWGKIVLKAINFFTSASPLIAAVILLRKHLFHQQKLAMFIFGEKPALLPYAIVVALFVFQFFTFYLFRTTQPPAMSVFISAWAGQILLGGVMEEGGWRGYLQPAIERKLHITMAVLIVGLVWALWHLPYFFLPGTFHTGGNFVFYIVTTTATAFTLTAIYKLTGSILLCTLFHGWQNTIVMIIPTDMEQAGFLTMFAVQTVVSVFLCIKPLGRVQSTTLIK